MQIQITKAKDGHWYHEYIGKIFDVEVNGSGEGYTLIYTTHNQRILSTQQDGKRREELFRRLKNTKTGFRLGVGGENAVRIEGETNNISYKTMLSREW